MQFMTIYINTTGKKCHLLVYYEKIDVSSHDY